MNSNSGKVMYRKFTKYSGLLKINGRRTVIKITMEIIMVNAIIRYLNFNENAPIMNILERMYRVNDAGFLIQTKG